MADRNIWVRENDRGSDYITREGFDNKENYTIEDHYLKTDSVVYVWTTHGNPTSVDSHKESCVQKAFDTGNVQYTEDDGFPVEVQTVERAMKALDDNRQLRVFDRNDRLVVTITPVLIEGPGWVEH